MQILFPDIGSFLKTKATVGIQLIWSRQRLFRVTHADLSQRADVLTTALRTEKLPMLIAEQGAESTVSTVSSCQLCQLHFLCFFMREVGQLETGNG